MEQAMIRFRRARLLAPLTLALSLGIAHVTAAQAQEPLKIVIGFPAGSGLDVLTRLIAEQVRVDTGMPIVVDNRPGGGGRIAAEYVAKAEPDGKTILSAPIVTTAFTPFVYKKLNFDPMKDLAPITRLGNFQFALATNNDVPAKSVKDFIAWVRANPGKVNYGSLSAGTPSHFLGEMFNRATGTDMQHIPYKGSAPVNIDLQAGQIQATFNTTVATMELFKGGKINLLAVTGSARSPSLPDVPTFKELNLNLGPMEDAELWYGFLAPGKTPAPLIAKLNAQIVAALKNPQIREKITNLDIQVVTDTPEEFAKVIANDYKLWGEIIKSTGFSLDQ
jgi:tripartite-type tricarboxylate transporter receptor subunit TctC